ncbi:MAG TPA: flagellar protein FlaG [Bryobacteraceae bacterium]|jgi:uncharacterized FlaG/YvyC family protein
MDIAPTNRAEQAPATTTVPAIPAEQVTQNREVIKAVKALNGSEMFGDNELMFQRDSQTQKMIVRVVDRNTNEVISQIPPEYVLRLAQDSKKQSS